MPNSTDNQTKIINPFLGSVPLIIRLSICQDHSSDNALRYQSEIIMRYLGLKFLGAQCLKKCLNGIGSQAPSAYPAMFGI